MWPIILFILVSSSHPNMMCQQDSDCHHGQCTIAGICECDRRYVSTESPCDVKRVSVLNILVIGTFIPPVGSIAWFIASKGHATYILVGCMYYFAWMIPLPFAKLWCWFNRQSNGYTMNAPSSMLQFITFYIYSAAANATLYLIGHDANGIAFNEF